MAWGVFALAWSERWGPRARVVPADPDAPSLQARSALAPAAQPIAALGVLASLGYLVFAFRVREPDRALVAQALALACSVAVVTAASTVATARGKSRGPAGRRLTAPVIRALLFLVTFAIAGAIVTHPPLSSRGRRATRLRSDPRSLAPPGAIGSRRDARPRRPGDPALFAAAVAFGFGLRALANRQDFEAIYLLVVGGFALRASTELLRPRGAAA